MLGRRCNARTWLRDAGSANADGFHDEDLRAQMTPSQLYDHPRSRASVTLLIVAAMTTTSCTPPTPGSAMHRRSQTAQAASLEGSGRPPSVAPMMFRAVAPADAVRINAAVPFAPGPTRTATEYDYPGSSDDEERATTCLAAAGWYEAGDDRQGEQAVMQVVLNRLRHPAFPKTVCGVVFQGAERATGCQFTFACDGSLSRQPTPAAWARARQLAAEALHGGVFKAVGSATHYHTNSVVPSWSAALEKIAQVGPHLFFHWKGLWGEVRVLRETASGSEKLDPRLAALDRPVAAPAPPMLATASLPALPINPPVIAPAVDHPAFPVLTAGTVALADEEHGQFIVKLEPTSYPGTYATDALRLCKDHPVCTVAGWLSQEKQPAKLPMNSGAMGTSAFIYVRHASGSEEAFWDCRQLRRENRNQCIPGTGGPGTS